LTVDHVEYVKQISVLFNDSSTLKDYLFLFADEEHKTNYYDILKISQDEIPFICICSCEGLTGKSHFFCFALLSMFQAINKLKQVRLGSAHRLKKLVDAFNSTILRNEPLYISEDYEHDKAIFYTDQIVEELTSTVYILQKYSQHRKSDPNRKDIDKTLHPFHVYWYLVKKLNIPIETATRYHTTHGIVRIILTYLMVYREKGNKNLVFSKNKLTNYYEGLRNEISESKEPIEIMPKAVDYEYEEVFNLLKCFYDLSVKKAIDEGESLKWLKQLTKLSLQILKISSEYINMEIIEKQNSLLKMMDDYLSILFSNSEDKDNAEYYYLERWKEQYATKDNFKSILW